MALNRSMRRHKQTMRALGQAVNNTPTAWFNQFPGLTEDSDWQNEDWCPRHWAPAALLGYQGMRASRMLLELYMSEVRPPNLNSPKAINRHRKQLGYLCCHFGDERMYQLWGQCAPVRE